MNDDDLWAEMTVKEIRLFIGEPTTGLWCPTCQLPSGWQAPVRRDPTEQPGSWIGGCTEHYARQPPQTDGDGL